MTRAILFDLFNTLVPSGDQRRGTTARAMGTDLGVDPEQFAALLVQTWPQRVIGALGDLAEQCGDLARRLGGDPDPAAIDAAVHRRMAFNRLTIGADEATYALLDALRTAGWSIGIVSNATIDSAIAFRETPLRTYADTVVFSCELGIAKPDPAIYRHACTALKAKPAGCVYVGDGADGELDGAAALGMRVIQTVQYARSDPHWAGERITSLVDLGNLAEAVR